MKRIVVWIDDFFGDRFHKRVFFICLIVSIFLLVASFFTPPKFIIDATVIAGTGELFAFAALGEIVAAIERGHSASITHGGTTVTIKKEDEEDSGSET